MRARLALLLSAVLWTQAALAALSPEAFTQIFAERLRAALPGRKVEILEPLKLRVTGGQGEEFTNYLDNAYMELQQNPDAREEIIGRRVAAAVEASGALPPLVAANIIPIIKDRAWLAEMDAAMRKNGAKVLPERVVDEINELLVIVYAEDTPMNIRYFSPDELEKAGIERGRLRALAVENLQRILPEVELHDGGEFKMLVAGGNYEASLLLLDHVWNGGSLKVQGEIVIGVPARDLLLVTGSENQRGLARIREIAAEVVAESPYALTRELFVYRKGRFVRFTQ